MRRVGLERPASAELQPVHRLRTCGGSAPASRSIGSDHAISWICRAPLLGDGRRAAFPAVPCTVQGRHRGSRGRAGAVVAIGIARCLWPLRRTGRALWRYRGTSGFGSIGQIDEGHRNDDGGDLGHSHKHQKPEQARRDGHCCPTINLGSPEPPLSRMAACTVIGRNPGCRVGGLPNARWHTGGKAG